MEQIEQTNCYNEPNCYNCVYRGSVPGDAHSCCLHPKTGMKSGDIFGGLVSLVSGETAGAARELQIKADAHGVRSGWFYWPANFDPVWLENCLGYTPKEVKEAAK